MGLFCTSVMFNLRCVPYLDWEQYYCRLYISVQLGHKILILCLINCGNQYHEFVLNGIYIILRKSSSIALPDNINITQLTNDLVTYTPLGNSANRPEKELNIPSSKPKKNTGMHSFNYVAPFELNRFLQTIRDQQTIAGLSSKLMIYLFASVYPLP